MNRRLAVFLSACVISHGCSATTQLAKAPKLVDKQEEAASSHISVLSVARWEDYAEAFQPTFALKPEEALEKAIPATMRLEERMVDALMARLKLAPPTSTSSSTESLAKEAVTTVAGETTTATSTTTASSNSMQAKGPGDISALTPSEFTTPSPKDLPGSGLSGTVAIDPITRYWAATALYQEVQALNRYIRDAATRSDSMPFVVRLQVSLLPVLRHQAYDATATFAFFTATDESKRPVVNPRLLGRMVPYQSGLWFEFTEDPREGQPKQCGEPLASPIVVPLLVTDSIENAIHSRSLSTIRDFGLTLGMLTGGFGIGADVEKNNEALSALVGNDLNSLLTVGRVADNSLRVRLGAMQQANSRYAMVPRTHNITVLVLVPKKQTVLSCEPSALHLVSRTEVIDSVRGITLRERTLPEVDVLLRDVALKHGLTTAGLRTDALLKRTAGAGTAEEDRTVVSMRRLLDMAQRGEQSRFRATVEGMKKDFAHLQMLWLDLISVMVGSRYAPAAIELPRPFKPAICKDCEVTIFDDTTSSVVTLIGATDLLASQLSATLLVGSVPNRVAIPSTFLATAAGGTQLTVRFPSLKHLAFTMPTGIVLRLDRRRSSWESETARWELNLTYRQVPTPTTEKPEPSATFSTGTTGLVSDKGTGNLQFTIDVKDVSKKHFISVLGAEVSKFASAPDGVLTQEGGRWRVSKPGTLDATLRNLIPGTDLVISLLEDKKLLQVVRLQVQKAS